ncbi:hypothetical protein [Kurthia massiliensis]|uniref:hypothetical protein n=1 Tax=Kurthia massiliensis TaxID=1033739 RepID=UPI000288B85A|nr:hypothetical protein [Kurthia massiliensis]
MGFWYFLMLFLGIALIMFVVTKRTKTKLSKWIMAMSGICMVALSLFMFQDGSAEIVDSWLKSFNIQL